MLNFVYIITKNGCILKRSIDLSLLPAANVHHRLHKRFPVAGPYSGTRFRIALKTAVDGTAENPFPLQRSQVLNTGALACGFAVEHSPLPPQRHRANSSPFPLHTAHVRLTSCCLIFGGMLIDPF